jgi:dipeptidyl aminopeptidase/acylaminoacyl peptidase
MLCNSSPPGSTSIADSSAPPRPPRYTSRYMASSFTHALAASLVLTVHSPIMAQPVYKQPPTAIAAALNAPPLPGVSLDPTRTTMVLMDRISLPPVSDLARPMLRLGGDRFDASNNGPHGPRRITGYTLKSIADGRETKVSLPPDSDLSAPAWSPDGTMFAFTRTVDTTIELWVTDVSTAAARKLAQGLNAASGAPLDWMPDGKTLLVRFVPEGRGPMPVRPLAPQGPVIQETSGSTAQVRTYQDLLTNPHDEQVFTWLMQTQLAYVSVTTGERNNIGTADTITGYDVSPDSNHILVYRLTTPYSYLVPSSLFPEVVELWDAKTGKVTKDLCRFPLREDIPIQGVQKGPRGYQWRTTAPATLCYVEALDEGDPKNKVPHRDKVMVLDAPFTAEAREWMRTEHRFSGVSWMAPTPGGEHLCTVSEFDRDRRWVRTWLCSFDNSQPPKVMFDRSTQDQYNNPGSMLTTRLASGRRAVRVEGSISEGNAKVYLSGQGAGPEGDRPFLNSMTLPGFNVTQLWRNSGESYESVIDLLPGDRILTSYETATQVPNYYVRDLGSASADVKPITNFTDPVPELRKVKKELVKYKRADGVDLSATLYLPANYVEGTRLPLFVWAYPLEFNDASTAGQVSGSTRRFTSIGGISHLFLLTQGYAVLDNATMPVIGDPETVNDTFIEQIAQAAKAAIDYAVERGVADRDRVAVGGHSYGAFMTANLLAHTDYFRAGIARSGAYNRTLTPFGFQGERRTYWEAVDTYTKMSPFTFAHKIKAPILMIHGQIDSNPGTFPVQSERLYAAVKGNGGTARLVMLPFEDHGYSGKESVMHTQAEMVEWLNIHLKK